MQKLSLKGICKEFPGVIANDNISIDFYNSEVHALLGENGAGKTTLMNIIYGIYKPDKGEILIDDKMVNIKSPKDAISYGIGMVHQHFMLIENHSVCENICLGLKEAPFLNPQKRFANKIEKISEKYGLSVDPLAKIWQLSAGQQQKVEIIKALIRGVKFLILDEPTSVLTPQESDNLFITINKLVQDGLGVIFISHKLEEVLKISNKITILRGGKVINSVNPSETNKNDLAKMMVGKDVLFEFNKQDKKDDEKSDNKIKKDILSVNNLWVKGDKGLYSVKNLSFTLKEGEILGVAGVSGNGQKELIEAIVGLRKYEKGEIKFLEKSLKSKTTKDISKLKISHIPEERLKFGSVPNFSLYDNVILKEYDEIPYCKKGIIQIKKIKERTKELVRLFNISTPSIDTPIKLLSGGNIQKLICARELSSNPIVIIAAHPTYGLDIAATAYIRSLLVQKRNEGSSILLVSEDLEEILSISDRVMVLFNGEISGFFKPDEVSLEKIGLMMTGVK